MTEKFLSVLRCILPVFLFPLLAMSSAQAGNVGFGLSLTGNRLSVTNQGNTSAFYPAVYRLTADGKWQQLAFVPGTSQPTELAASNRMELVWPDTRPPASLPLLEAPQPVMVRFFDQAGAGFGQISFFNQPPTAEQTLEAGYEGGKMHIAPPADKADNPVRASWLVWAREDGIVPLQGKVEFSHVQPDARRLDWSSGLKAQTFDLGAGLPVAFLLHETAQGLRLQVVSDGRVQGRQQRAAWLDQAIWLEREAQALAVAGLAVLLWHLVAASRRRVEA